MSYCSSFKANVDDLDNVDYEVHVAYLFGKIVPEKCYTKVSIFANGDCMDILSSNIFYR